jgi:hypothetical protein
MRLFEITSALSILCLLVSLRPAQDLPETKPTLPTGAKVAIATLRNEMQGAWRLVALESPTLIRQNRHELGFLLVTDNYFSFELHLGWLSPDGRIDEKSFSSGTHRFELDERGRMSSSSVIGSFVDVDKRIQFEQPGKVRSYDVTCIANKMTLKREDGTKFEFERMSDSKAPRDIFGRPLKLKESGEVEKPPKREPKKDGEPK